MPRTCFCNDLDCCSRCRAYETHPAYAEWAVLPKGWKVGCRHRGAETRRVECPTCCGKVELKVFSCAKHGECTAAKPTPGRACCQGCPDYAAQEVVTVNMGAGGLGDGILGLAAVGALKKEHPDKWVVYKVGGRALPFVRLFGGYDELREYDFDSNDSVRLPGPDRQANVGYQHEISGRDATPRWERYCRNVGASQPTLPELRDPNRLRRLGEDFVGAVALAPFSAWSDREYSVPGWLALEALLARSGYRTVVLHDDAERCRPLKSEQVVGQSAERVAGVLLNAVCLVGCDSGLSHLAGALGRPTIVLCGQTVGERIFGLYPRAVCLTGELGCGGCYWHGVWHARSCQPHCPNLQTITPRRILAAVDAICLPPLGDDQSMLSAGRLAGLRDALLATRRLPGDMAELGVFRGGSARFMAHFAAGKTLHLFDTFEGLPADCPEGRHRAGEFAGPAGEVRQRLAGFPVELHTGVFPATTAALADVRYACVHLDADLYESTRAAIAYFWPRMVAGGRIVFDDWLWRDTPGVTRAIQEAFRDDEIEETALHQCQVKKP